MAITVSCACGQGFRVKDDLAGKTAKCPKCNSLLTIPAAPTAGELGQLSLDDLMKMDAAAPLGVGMGMPAEQPSAAGAPQSPSGGFAAPGAGGFQTAGFPFGQGAQTKASSGSNKKLLMLCGMGGVALLAVFGALFMLMRGGESNSTSSVANNAPVMPSASGPTGTGNPTSQKALALAALAPVKLEAGGRATVELRVERNGNEGPIQVQLAGAPEGVTTTALEIPAGQSVAQLAVAAAESLGEVSAKLDVTIKVGQAQATQPLNVTVSKANVPAFQPVAGIVVQPGTTATVNLAIQRNGYVGPLEVRPEGVSEKISIKATNVAEGQNESKLEVAAAIDTPDAAHMLRIAATAQGRTINLAIPLNVEQKPFTVKSLMVVTLKPGESKTVQFPVERRSYKGPIHVAVDNLPDGVTTPQLDVTPDKPAASVTLTAAAETKELIRSAKVVASAAHLKTNDDLLIRVSRGESGFLPREVVANKEFLGLLKRGSFGGRLTSTSKKALLDAYGGSDQSERAVMYGLKWLAGHQRSDGRWSLKAYNQGIPSCDCLTPFEAKVQDNDTAGTAFGLLPFLGAGVTHNRAPDKELEKFTRTVKDGLNFLVKNQVAKSTDVKQVGNLGGGSMYSHALATMALCEAYGLSGDETYRIPAQKAVRYLVESQHSGGGWRYGPNQPGDMSVTGWVFLAIRDGQLAGIPVASEPLKKAERFLDSVAAGPPEAKLSRYGYDPGTEAKLTLTAAGLLSRQYLQIWKKDDPQLIAGCKFLMEKPNLPPAAGKALGAMYYYYYATQVLHHMEGEEFDLWNYYMREHLLRTQQVSGHRLGSWDPETCEFGETGGRLYSTGMALLTLEVYYRHLPLYRSLNQLKELTKTKE